MKLIKKCIIFGDSISTTNFSGGGYEKMIKERLQIEVVENYAQNTAALTSGYPLSVCDKIIEAPCDSDAELVIIWAGTNDWFYSVNIGESDTMKNDCFCGSLRCSALEASKKYTNADIVFLTPIFRFSNHETTDFPCDAYYTKNDIGSTLLDYYNAIISVSHTVGFDVCNMRVLCGINAANHEIYLRDGTHPSKKGYEKIARIISNHILYTI